MTLLDAGDLVEVECRTFANEVLPPWRLALVVRRDDPCLPEVPRRSYLVMLDLPGSPERWVSENQIKPVS